MIPDEVADEFLSLFDTREVAVPVTKTVTRISDPQLVAKAIRSVEPPARRARTKDLALARLRAFRTGVNAEINAAEASAPTRKATRPAGPPARYVPAPAPRYQAIPVQNGTL